MLLYALTIFLGAFLLFQIQPMIGKYVLPWFGGAPAVWSTCLVFFQLVLLAGYLYAHALATRVPRRAVRAVHCDPSPGFPRRHGRASPSRGARRSFPALPGNLPTPGLPSEESSRILDRRRRPSLSPALLDEPLDPILGRAHSPDRPHLPPLRPLQPRLAPRPGHLPHPRRALHPSPPPILALVGSLRCLRPLFPRLRPPRWFSSCRRGGARALPPRRLLFKSPITNHQSQISSGSSSPPPPP